MSEFRLREGMFCRDAEGKKVGPVKKIAPHLLAYTDGKSGAWSEDGSTMDYKNAAPALVVEWIDTPAEPEWSEWMTPAQADDYVGGGWSCGDSRVQHIGWVCTVSVPVSRKAVRRERVELYWHAGFAATSRKIGGDTHRITFDLVNGIPDCASIKMEEI